MPKKKSDAMGKQLSFRLSDELYERLEILSRAMNLDPTAAVRVLLAEHIPVVEERFRVTNEAQGKRPKQS